MHAYGKFQFLEKRINRELTNSTFFIFSKKKKKSTLGDINKLNKDSKTMNDQQ